MLFYEKCRFVLPYFSYVWTIIVFTDEMSVFFKCFIHFSCLFRWKIDGCQSQSQSSPLLLRVAPCIGQVSMNYVTSSELGLGHCPSLTCCASSPCEFQETSCAPITRTFQFNFQFQIPSEVNWKRSSGGSSGGGGSIGGGGGGGGGGGFGDGCGIFFMFFPLDILNWVGGSHFGFVFTENSRILY